MKYIDAEKLVAEIERLKSTNPSEYNYQNAEGYTWALDDLLSFIDNLSEEPGKSLEEEIKKYIDEYGYERGEDKLLIAIVARHFAEWQKEQMMKEAVEYEVVDFSSSLEAHPHVNIPLDNKKYRSGNKVRIIVLPKEDEK